MNKIKLEELKARYSQQGDNAGGEDWQDIEIQTQDAGGGIYYTIKTERWAFENIKEVADIIKDFEKRFNLKTKITESE